MTRARSSIHDTTTRWGAVRGWIELDPDDLGRGATAELTVDMASCDAGDFLKNRKLRKDLELERHPEARFVLASLGELAARGDHRHAARATGVIHWRGRQVEIAVPGEARIDAARVAAEASFELDITRFGIAAPRFLLFKVEDVVTVEVSLVAEAGERIGNK